MNDRPLIMTGTRVLGGGWRRTPGAIRKPWAEESAVRRSVGSMGGSPVRADVLALSENTCWVINQRMSARQVRNDLR
jgi:hypothetical protein